MAVRYKVTFFDVEHAIHRSVEIQEGSPIGAAKAALRWMLGNDRYLTDFADSVRVEVITTSEVELPLSVIANGANERELKVA